MTSNDIVNASLLTVGGAFVAEAIRLLATNFYFAVIAAVVGTAIFSIREILP